MISRATLVTTSALLLVMGCSSNDPRGHEDETLETVSSPIDAMMLGGGLKNSWIGNIYCTASLTSPKDGWAFYTFAKNTSSAWNVDVDWCTTHAPSYDRGHPYFKADVVGVKIPNTIEAEATFKPSTGCLIGRFASNGACWAPSLYLSEKTAGEMNGGSDMTTTGLPIGSHTVGTGAARVEYSYDGRPAGMSAEQCVNLNETSDPGTWGDNYLCFAADYGIKFSEQNPIANMRCELMDEPSDEHQTRSAWGWGGTGGVVWGYWSSPWRIWADNYICVPNDSPWTFKWSNNGSIDGQTCIHVHEPAEPVGSTWSDNFLCWSSAPTTLPGAMTCAPATCDIALCGLQSDGCGGTLDCGPCTTTTTCTAGTSVCSDNTCHDFATDPMNCGGCGPSTGGTSDHDCMSSGIMGAGCYGGVCQCAPGQYVSNGMCITPATCTAGTSVCSDNTCHDFATDPMNCGGCGPSTGGTSDHDCMSSGIMGAGCYGGVCQCPPGQLAVDGMCQSAW